MKKKYLILNILLILGCIIFNSCTPVKNVVYFQNSQSGSDIRNVVDNNFELKIRKNDLLGINIISPDPVNTPLFNGLQSIPTSAGEAGGGTGPSGGFLVDNNGNIVIYKLGTIHVEGMTRNELRQKLQTDLSPYLKDAVVNVRFLSNHITVLGEVSKPQVLTMANEKLTLLDAIGMSGDIPLTGRKDNILIIRETPTGKQFNRVNLTNNSIFNSPFYYLQPDDVIYVEPSAYRIKNAGSTPQVIGYALSALSILITIILTLIR